MKLSSCSVSYVAANGCKLEYRTENSGRGTLWIYKNFNSKITSKNEENTAPFSNKVGGGGAC